VLGVFSGPSLGQRAVIVALLAACLHTAPQRDRGVRPALSTAEALERTLAPQRRAILIGVERYDDPRFPPLQHAIADAQGLGAILGGQDGGFDEVVVLEDASREEIFRALLRAREDLRREDVLVVYFSGHGLGLAEEGWRRYLLPSDSRSRDLDGTAIELEALQSFFSALAPQRKALIVDACFSGDGKSVPSPQPGGETTPLLSLPPSALSGGESHLFATSAGRPSREDDRLGHGVYTWYLMDALTWSFSDADSDGDGVVTAYEAHDHARGRTMSHTGQVQVPEATFRIVGEGDLVLAGSRDAQREREQALIYLYTSAGQPLYGSRVVLDGRDRGALPGALAVPPGRHHLGLYASDGSPLAEGYLTLRSGQVYPADGLARMARGPSAAVGLSAAGVGAAPVGGVGAGISARWARRDNSGDRRGMVSLVELGLAQGARASQWATVGLGVQQDHRRLRYRAGWSVGAVNVLPDSALPGWLYAVSGPRIDLGVVLDEQWSVVLGGQLSAAWVDPVLGGQPSLQPWAVVGLGLEAAR